MRDASTRMKPLAPGRILKGVDVRRFASFIGVLLVFVFIAACSDGGAGGSEVSGGRPVVYTTFYPTTYFVSRLAGDLVEVVCPVPPDEDAIFWKPDAEMIERYQQADLIVINGAEFEKWVATASLPLARVVDTARPFRDDFVRFETGVTHAHGPAGAHSHVGTDGHTWLDPVNAKAQVAEIQAALVKLLPDQQETIAANAAALLADLDALDTQFRQLADTYEGELILASHPAYNYLKKRYGWNLGSLDLDPENMPDAEAMAGLARAQEETPARFILWESEPTEEIRERFERELGLTSVVFSPCELMDPAELAAGVDYLTVMLKNLKALAPVMGAK